MNRAKSNPDIPARFQSNCSGFFPSAKNRRPITYANLIERDFAVLLEDDRDVLGYDAAPEPLIWSHGGAKWTTAFEFSYRLPGERRILAAVKASATIVKFRLAELYRAARASALEAGFSDLKLLYSEREIRAMPRLANAEMKVFQRPPENHDALDLAVLSALHMGGGRMSLRRLRRRCGLEANAYRAIVRLIAEGAVIAADPEVLLDDDAELIARGRPPVVRQNSTDFDKIAPRLTEPRRPLTELVGRLTELRGRRAKRQTQRRGDRRPARHRQTIAGGPAIVSRRAVAIAPNSFRATNVGWRSV
jgi:hypothetical protein